MPMWVILVAAMLYIVIGTHLAFCAMSHTGAAFSQMSIWQCMRRWLYVTFFWPIALLVGIK